MPITRFSERLRNYMKMHGISKIAEMSRRLGLDRSTASRLFHGRSHPSKTVELLFDRLEREGQHDSLLSECERIVYSGNEKAINSLQNTIHVCLGFLDRQEKEERGFRPARKGP